MDNHLEPVPVVEQPLTVDVVDGEICVDGAVNCNVSISPAAAIETGKRLINAGMKMDEDPAHDRRH